MAFDSLSVDTNNSGRVVLSWNETSAPSDVFVDREDQSISGSYGPQRVYADLSPGDQTFTDLGVEGGTTYRWTVRHEDSGGTTTDSASVEATNPTPSGVNAERTTQNRWRVEVETEAGTILEPDVIGEPEWKPKLNSLPRVEVPVPRDEKWKSDTFDRADMRVYYDGRKLPIEEMGEPALRTDRTILRGFGGRELLTRANVSYDQIAADVAAKDLVQAQSTYGTNFDDPVTLTKTGEQLAFYDTQTDFQSATALNLSETTNPVSLLNGTVDLLQNAFFLEGEDYTMSGTVSDSAASAGSAETIFSDGTFSSTQVIDLDYTIPDGNVGVAIRTRYPNDPDSDGNFEGGGFDIKINGFTAISLPNPQSRGSSDYQWTTVDDAHVSSLSGQNDITVEAQGNATRYTSYLDAVVIYDSRYTYTFDNNVDANGYLSGPALYAAEFDVPFENESGALNIDAATVSVTMNSGSAPAAVGLSVDDGETWQEGLDTTSFTYDFTEVSLTVRGRVTLGPHGSRTTASPTEDYLGQSIDTMTIEADLDDTPVLRYQGWDDNAISVLRNIADQSNSIFELRVNDSGNIQVEWTRYGVRSDDPSPPIEDYTVEKSTEGQHQSVVVQGMSGSRFGEEIVADHGTPVSLFHDLIDESSETVQTDRSSIPFTRGVDYDIDYENGTINTNFSGEITDGQNLIVDYRFHTTAEYTVDGATPPIRPKIEEFPSIRDLDLAGAVAAILAERLATPQWKAEVLVSEMDPSQSLVSELDIDELPSDVTMEIRDIEHTDMGVRLHLGNRGTPAEEISSMKNTLRNTMRKA